jgi:site-specific recombinase XerD
MHTARVLLEEALPAGASVAQLCAAAVERHVNSMSTRLSRQSMQHHVCQLRSFLRFCYDCGLIDTRLDGIDTVRTYRDELPPRALPWQMVKDLLRSIDRRSTGGWRDYAILHLMAFYGLRPSEVVALRLDSIDWEAKILRVEQRKTRSALILPLDERTLRILKRYLQHGRPGSDRPELFVRARTPSGPIKNTAIVEIFDKRVLASGLPITEATSYSLRHSFAMRLLERGVGVKAIGDVLGHRSLEATCVYLRLHTEALRDVALPLPHTSVRGR